MGFLFVDHITALDTEQASGWFDLPDHTAVLPPWLAIEAVGQLAAWIAMLRCDFRQRPVAALVGEVRLSGAPVRERVLLSARVERFDGRAILYSGSACSGEEHIADLARCVGPMLPMEAFDDPDAVRARLAALRETAVAAPHVLPISMLAEAGPEGTDKRRGLLQVPEDAPFFADHFPRRPVYPATLLADAQNQLALPLAAAAFGVAPDRARPRRVSEFKVRAFSAPGQRLELLAELQGRSDDGVTVAVSGYNSGKRIATGLFEYCVSP